MVNSKDIKISIIVPSFNYGHLLPAAISSIRNQGIDDIEIIIINDYSTDDTDQVVAELLGKDTVYIKNSRNQGVHKSMNIGFKAARGTYVCVLAADDVFSDGSLQARYDQIIDLDCDAVHAGITISQDGVERYVQPLDHKDKQNIVSFLQGSNDLYGINNATFMYHRRVFDKIGYRDESDRFFPHNDYEFALRTLLHCDVSTLDSSTYFYVIHPKSHSAKHAHNTGAQARYDDLRLKYIELFSVAG